MFLRGYLDTRGGLHPGLNLSSHTIIKKASQRKYVHLLLKTTIMPYLLKKLLPNGITLNPIIIVLVNTMKIVLGPERR